MVDLLCAFSEQVSLLQLVKPPLIYVIRGHDNDDNDFPSQDPVPYVLSVTNKRLTQPVPITTRG